MLKAYILVKIMISKRLIVTLLSFLVFLPQSACGPFKFKKVNTEKDVPINVRERVKKNLEEGKGFRLMNAMDKGNTYDFASSNPLWRATLDTLDFMPLVSANYSGGIVVTDWYSDCLLYTSPSPRDGCRSRMPSSA